MAQELKEPRTNASASDLDDRFEAAVAAGRRQGAATCPHVVAGEDLYDGPEIAREDPSAPLVTVSRCHDAPPAVVQRAVAAAREAQREWGKVQPAERAARVRHGLELLTPERKQDIAATIALETGKPRGASRMDVEETAAFIDMYSAAVSEPGAFETQLDAVEGPLVTRSELRPYGVFGVIVPFNYPLPLAAGPTIAALLSGNGVVIKPPHLAPRSTHALYTLLSELELPNGLVNIVHGGDGAGRALVASDVDGIAFTGSAEAGLSIISALQSAPYPRPVIAEMGGKNPAIVTDGASLEDAVGGITFSAFDIAGQKCSACSRVLATPGIHDELVDQLAKRAETLRIGEPLDRDAEMGPLISSEVLERYERIIKAANETARVVTGGRRLDSEGYFVAPTIVADVAADHELVRTEHFLPFLTVSRVENFDAAISEANALDVGLTAGIYTGDEDEARRFLNQIEAGCVDVNNPDHATTGFWPGRQTFGGWKGSASTGKLGFGRWYVLQFAREQCRTMPRDL